MLVGLLILKALNEIKIIIIIANTRKTLYGNESPPKRVSRKNQVAAVI